VLNLRLSRAKTNAEIDHIRSQIASISQDMDIKKMDQELSKLNLTRGDPALVRLVEKALSSPKFKEVKEKVKRFLKPSGTLKRRGGAGGSW